LLDSRPRHSSVLPYSVRLADSREHSIFRTSRAKFDLIGVN